VAIAGKWARSKARQRTGCRSVVPWPGQALGVRAIRGCRWRGPCWQRSTIGSSAGPSFSRSVKPATKRRRRQGRAVPGGDRRQVGQVEGETAQRLPIGRAVAWSGSRGAGNPRLPLAWPVLAALDHRQFGRAFVLSIGEAGHEATTAPVSSGAWWRSPASGPGRRRDSATAADRACRGLVRLSGCLRGCRRAPGCRWRGPCWQRSITGSSVGPSSSRSVKPATKRRRRQCRAVPGGDRRQVGQVEDETAQRLPIGVAVACGQDLGVLAVLDHRQFGGSSSSRSVKPATRRRRRQCRAVPGGDRRQVGQVEDETAHRLPIGVAVAWAGSRGAGSAGDHRQFGRVFVLSIGEAGHEATTAPASSGAGWRSPASGAKANARQRNGCRSGAVAVRLSGCRIAAGVARAGSARPSAVRSGLRSLDR
jgi:hypothetical protein